MKKGFTLIEVLVSLFIFTLVILAAYKIYDHSQKTYLLGEQLTDAQQSVRFAFEKVSLDLRTAGYHVYPDSDALRTDLPIEGMWTGAIAVRADYDREEEPVLECTKDAITNECDPGTGQFGLVTTGNRDIHVFVLAKKAPDPGSGADPVSSDGSDETLKFKADFSAPRDGVIGNPGTLETVTINGISLTQDKPPYKLYQITFLPADDPDYSVPDGGAVPSDHMIWTPIADGIFTMGFQYYNQNGVSDANLMEPDDADASEPDDWPLFRRTHGWPFGGSGAGGGEVVKNALVTLIGMTARPDGRYTDPLVGTDTSGPRWETRNHRKYELTTTLNMMNVGVAPHELADTVPPDDPTQLEEVTGYCSGALLTWNPVMAQDLAVYWIQVVDSGLWSSWGGGWKYNCDDAPNTCTPTSNVEAQGGRVGFYIRNLTNTATYHARVFAQDSAGNFSRNPTNAIDFVVDPHPLKPLGAVVTGGAEIDYGGLKRLQVTFTPPEEYDTAQSSTCIGDVATKDANWPTLRDLYGYRLYHRRQLASPPSDPMNAGTITNDELVADEATPAGNPLKIPAVQYPDIKACPCEYYAYKMKSVTQCTDADDDLAVPCHHTGDVSDISKDADGNPVAYLAPEFQPFGTYPQIVPAQPLKPGAVATPTGVGDDYDIVLQFPPVMTSNLKSDTGAFSANPAADQQVEVWRYRIYEYTEDPDVVSGATATLIDDTDIGTNDTADWDAGVDGFPNLVALGAGAMAKFKITREVPSGQMRWYAVTGIYNCTGGIYEGPRSLAVSVPCNAAWTATITAPAIDYTLVNAGGLVYTVMVNVTGLVAPTTITGMSLTIANAGVVNVPLTLTCGPTSCTATYAWNLTGLPDGDYPILVAVVDSAGCSSTINRIATINQTCAAFQVFTINPPAGNKVTWEFKKINGVDVFLLDTIGFISQTYLTTLLNFYATNPTVGTPPATTLWSGAATNLNGKTIGLSGTDYPYANVNLCNAGATKALDLNPYPYPTIPAGTSNWFQATYDKNITSANGPLNLYTSLKGRKCMPTTTTYAMTAGGTAQLSLTAGQLPICAWAWTWSGTAAKTPTVDTTNICNGTIKWTGKTGMGAAGTITLTYWTPSGTFDCSTMPILMGP